MNVPYTSEDLYHNDTDRKNSLFKIKMFSIVVVVFILVTYMYTSLIGATMSNISNHRYSLNAYQGVLDISHIDLEETFPVEINGNWFYYPNVYFDGTRANLSANRDYSYISFPIRDYSSSLGTATFQSFIKFNYPEDASSPLALSIQIDSSNLNVYMNGQILTPFKSATGDLSQTETHTLYYIDDAYIPTQAFQEIIISTINKPSETSIYRRVVSIGTVANTVAYERTNFFVEFFSLGTVLTIVLISIIFILIKPKQSVLTTVNLADIALFFHIFFYISKFPYLIVNNSLITYNINLNYDRLFAGLDFATLFLFVLLINIFSQQIFDPHRQVSEKISTTINIYCIAGMALFGLFPHTYTAYGKTCALLGSSILFVAILMRLRTCYKNGYLNRFYMILQFVKTCIIGIAVFIDMLRLSTNQGGRAIVIILYASFFLINLYVRAIEYNRPFLEVTKQNDDYKDIINQHEQQIFEVSNALEELSNHDRATGIFNKIYFEQQLDANIKDFYDFANPLTNINISFFEVDCFESDDDKHRSSYNPDEDVITFVENMNRILPRDTVFARLDTMKFGLLILNYDDQQVTALFKDIKYSVSSLYSNREPIATYLALTKLTTEQDKHAIFNQLDKCLYHSHLSGSGSLFYSYGDHIDKI